MMKMNRWELDKELDRLKQQGFSEEQAYCVIACMEMENENDIRTTIKCHTKKHNS